MSWENYGNPNGDHSDSWSIDHIVPCSTFDMLNEDHVKACFHYSNIRPMWSRDKIIEGELVLGNLSKGNKITKEYVPEKIKKLNIL